MRRRLGLPLLLLYGVGITVGAGIYVLIGAVAGHAGRYAPWSFALAAAAMALTVGSYAELSTRFPVSAGEAAYVRAALDSRVASTAVGLVTLVIGIVASATVSLGAAGYIGQFVALPQGVIAAGVVIALGAVAAWGILESVLLASLFTLIEVGGLVFIIAAGVQAGVPAGAVLLTPPPLEPRRAVRHRLCEPARLLRLHRLRGSRQCRRGGQGAASRHSARHGADADRVDAALSRGRGDRRRRGAAAAARRFAGAARRWCSAALTGASPLAISLIAIVATLNTILAQMSMAARVIYGMARQGDLPRGARPRASRRRRRRCVATALVVAATLALALTVPFERLAEGTSLATLAVFATVNLSLLRLRAPAVPSPHPHARVPIWVPAAGLATCLAMIAVALLA